MRYRKRVAVDVLSPPELPNQDDEKGQELYAHCLTLISDLAKNNSQELPFSHDKTILKKLFQVVVRMSPQPADLTEPFRKAILTAEDQGWLPLDCFYQLRHLPAVAHLVAFMDGKQLCSLIERHAKTTLGADKAHRLENNLATLDRETGQVSTLMADILHDLVVPESSDLTVEDVLRLGGCYGLNKLGHRIRGFRQSQNTATGNADPLYVEHGIDPALYFRTLTSIMLELDDISEEDALNRQDAQGLRTLFHEGSALKTHYEEAKTCQSAGALPTLKQRRDVVGRTARFDRLLPSYSEELPHWVKKLQTQVTETWPQNSVTCAVSKMIEKRLCLPDLEKLGEILATKSPELQLKLLHFGAAALHWKSQHILRPSLEEKLSQPVVLAHIERIVTVAFSEDIKAVIHNYKTATAPFKEPGYTTRSDFLWQWCWVNCQEVTQRFLLESDDQPKLEFKNHWQRHNEIKLKAIVLNVLLDELSDAKSIRNETAFAALANYILARIESPHAKSETLVDEKYGPYLQISKDICDDILDTLTQEMGETTFQAFQSQLLTDYRHIIGASRLALRMNQNPEKLADFDTPATGKQLAFNMNMSAFMTFDLMLFHAYAPEGNKDLRQHPSLVEKQTPLYTHFMPTQEMETLVPEFSDFSRPLGNETTMCGEFYNFLHGVWYRMQYIGEAGNDIATWRRELNDEGDWSNEIFTLSLHLGGALNDDVIMASQSDGDEKSQAAKRRIQTSIENNGFEEQLILRVERAIDYIENYRLSHPEIDSIFQIDRLLDKIQSFFISHLVSRTEL